MKRGVLIGTGVSAGALLLIAGGAAAMILGSRALASFANSSARPEAAREASGDTASSAAGGPTSPSTQASGTTGREQSTDLEVRQGTYFRYAIPAGWQSNETMNGVDITAPGGTSGASFVLLVGQPGATTPSQFVLQAPRAIGIADARILGRTRAPELARSLGGRWQVEEIDLAFSVRGVPIRAHDTCAVANGYGSYSAVIAGYGASEQDWDQQKGLLRILAHSVVITGGARVAGQDTLLQAQNHPYDSIYGGTDQAWAEKQRSEDRISQAWHEAISGSDRMKDPETGRMYTMPHEYYDPTVGGYRNPARPDELLRHADPGE